MLTSLAFLAGAIVFNSVTNLMCYLRRVVDPQPLPDVLHDLIPLVTDSNHALNISLAAYVAFAVFAPFFTNGNAIHLVNRFCIHIGCMFILRGLMTPLTSMPDPSPGCAGPEPLGAYPYIRIWEWVSCGDLVLSGHTTVITTAGLVLFKAFPIRKVWHAIAAVCIFCGTALALVFIVVTRLHYSSDVAMTAILNVSMWVSGQVFLDTLRARPTVMPCLQWWCHDDYGQFAGPPSEQGKLVCERVCVNGKCCAGCSACDCCCELLQ
jgi:uncharacterized protein (DUF2062 family)